MAGIMPLLFTHTNEQTLPFNLAEMALHQEWDIVVVSQLFATNDLTAMLYRQETEAPTHRLQHYPFLNLKLQLLRSQLHHNNFLDKTSVAVSTPALLFRKEHNITQTYKKVLGQEFHSTPKLPAAYSTRSRMGTMSLKNKTSEMPTTLSPHFVLKNQGNSLQNFEHNNLD
jgi:hypothetical protein